MTEDSESLEITEHDEEFLNKMLGEVNTYIDKYALQNEESGFNEIIMSQTPDYSMPPWFTNVNAIETLLKQYISKTNQVNKIKNTLQKQLELLTEKTEPTATIDIDGLNRQRDRLLRQVQDRKNYLEQLKQQDRYAKSMQNQQYSASNYRSEIDKVSVQLDEIKKKINERTIAFQKVCREEKQISDAFVKATSEITALAKSLKKCEDRISDIVMQRVKLEDENNELQKKIAELETEKTKGDLKKKQIEDELADHDQMLAAHSLAEKQLQREREIEESALAKLSEAEAASKDYEIEAQRLHNEANSMKEEVKRARQNLTDTLTSLRENARRKITQINFSYEQKIEDADKQLSRMLEENAQLSASIETLRRQLTFIESQNAVLRADDGRGSTAFEEFSRSATAQLDVLTSQLGDLSREAQRLKDEEKRQKARVSTAEIDVERTVSTARRSLDKTESELGQVRTMLSEAEATSASLAAENQKLQAELERAQTESKRSLEMRIAEKETELRVINGKLDEARRSHIEKMGELQRAFNQTKRYSQQLQTEAENTATRNEAELQDKEEELDHLDQLAANLEAELNRLESEGKQSHAMIIKRQQDLANIKREQELAQQRELEQKTQIDQLNEQQIRLVSQREQLQNDVDEKKTQLKRIQRQINTYLQIK